ncbi:MAG: aminoacyl-histidine dipeptidase [Ruminococcaceae bacterium]|nr:aminoacyl-histidine dipeptidase [Oscillospiraceae bacterium]
MDYILSDYSPKDLFRYFEDICAIPHGSGNEKAIADYLCKFAEDNNLEYYRDEIHNVLIKKKASKGYENKPAVLLQGHTDMVCEKNNDVVHDFDKDPLKIYEKDGWLYADGTTLGGDDGIAVVMMMAVLADKNANHPPLECLFTVQEETSMAGAIAFDYSKLSARSFINLDCENISYATVSCAGGVRCDLSFELDLYKNQNSPIKITVKGLAGGHSGTGINSGKQNANIIMAKLLVGLYEKMPFNLISINGGNKVNAIPRECECVISVFDKKLAKETIKSLADTIRKQLIKEDKKFSVRIDNANGASDTAFCFKDTYRVISTMNILPNGVYEMSRSLEGLVETSSNLGVVTTTGNTVNIYLMPRSSVEAKLDEIVMKFDIIAKLAGAKIVHHDRYPGWEYAPTSKMRDLFEKCYENKFGRKPVFEAVHAGVECGIIITNMGGDLDGISMGATVRGIHTPEEHLDLASLSDAYEIMLDMLKQL